MVRRELAMICLAVGGIAAGAPDLARWQLPQDFTRADAATRRLAPSAIPNVPPKVRRTLEQRGCTVPQVPGKAAPHNAIRGAFTVRGTAEWAVLCSREKVSSIVVIAESSGAIVAEVGPRADALSLQTISPPDTIWYSRAISRVDARRVRIVALRELGRSAPAIVHDGIDDAFVEKASVVWYWDGKTWLRFTGAD